MHFEPAPFAKGTTVGLGGRRGKLLIDVDGSEFIGGGSAGFVHQVSKSYSRIEKNEKWKKMVWMDMIIKEKVKQK